MRKRSSLGQTRSLQGLAVLLLVACALLGVSPRNARASRKYISPAKLVKLQALAQCLLDQVCAADPVDPQAKAVASRGMSLVAVPPSARVPDLCVKILEGDPLLYVWGVHNPPKRRGPEPDGGSISLDCGKFDKEERIFGRAAAKMKKLLVWFEECNHSLQPTGPYDQYMGDCNPGTFVITGVKKDSDAFYLYQCARVADLAYVEADNGVTLLCNFEALADGIGLTEKRRCKLLRTIKTRTCKEINSFRGEADRFCQKFDQFAADYPDCVGVDENGDPKTVTIMVKKYGQLSTWDVTFSPQALKDYLLAAKLEVVGLEHEKNGKFSELKGGG